MFSGKFTRHAAVRRCAGRRSGRGARRGLNVAEMSGLDPEGATFPASSGAELPLPWKPQPGLRREFLAAFPKRAIEHQKFAAAGKFERNRSAWQPAFNPYVLAAVLEQRGGFDAGPTLRMRVRHRLSVAAHGCAVRQIDTHKHSIKAAMLAVIVI